MGSPEPVEDGTGAGVAERADATAAGMAGVVESITKRKGKGKGLELVVESITKRNGKRKGVTVIDEPKPEPVAEPTPAKRKGKKDPHGPVEQVQHVTTTPEMDALAGEVLAAQDAQERVVVIPRNTADAAAVGTTVYVEPVSVNADPERNGRALDTKKVKEYAKDFAARIAAGLDPQLQECAGYYPAGSNTLHLVFGFHRHAAALLVPGMPLRVRVVPEPEPVQALLDNWTENSKHNNLTPVSEMRYMTRLRDAYGMDQKAIAHALGVSPSLVSLRLQLEGLDAATLKLVTNGVLPVKSAYALAAMENPAKRAKAMARVVEVFSGLGDADVIAKIKLPKTAMVQAAIDAVETYSADGGGEGATIPVPELPRKLTTGKMEKLLQNVVKYPDAPKPVKETMRAVLGWMLGQRTTAAMLKSVCKQVGADPVDWTQLDGVAPAGVGAEVAVSGGVPYGAGNAATPTAVEGDA